MFFNVFNAVFYLRAGICVTPDKRVSGVSVGALADGAGSCKWEGLSWAQRPRMVFDSDLLY